MASTTTPQTHCYLFDIPIELRLIIYEDIISTFTMPYDDCSSYAAPAGQYLLPLLNTCTQIRQEAAKAYHARLHEIMNTALSGVTSAMADIAEWLKRPPMGSVWHEQQAARLFAAEKQALKHYKKVSYAVNGESVMAKDDMEGVGTPCVGCIKEERVRDVFGDRYVVSAMRKTYGREWKSRELDLRRSL